MESQNALRRILCIYMFEKGELIESGSHDELMRQNGKYAEIFNLQAEKYRRDAEE